MLRLGQTILSPLRTRFEDSKLPPARSLNTPLYTSFADRTFEVEPEEDVTRNARMEVMMKATERLKEAEDVHERIQVESPTPRLRFGLIAPPAATIGRTAHYERRFYN